MSFKTMIGALAALGMSLLLAAPAAAADRGTRDEAMAMSHAAKALVEAEGAEAAAAAINDPNDARFHDRDLYVYYLTLDHVFLAHGAKPQLTGKNVAGLRDPNGVMIIQEMANIIRTDGEGWVDYVWQNPASGALEKKSGYVEKVDDNSYIGVGVYSE